MVSKAARGRGPERQRCSQRDLAPGDTGNRPEVQLADDAAAGKEGDEVAIVRVERDIEIPAAAFWRKLTASGSVRRRLPSALPGVPAWRIADS